MSTKAMLIKLAEAEGYTVVERWAWVRLPLFDEHVHELYYDVMHGETRICTFNRVILKHWVDKKEIIRKLALHKPELNAPESESVI